MTALDDRRERAADEFDAAYADNTTPLAMALDEAIAEATRVDVNGDIVQAFMAGKEKHAGLYVWA